MPAKANDSPSEPAKQSQKSTSNGSEESSTDQNNNSCPNNKLAVDQSANGVQSLADPNSLSQVSLKHQLEELVFNLKWSTKKELVNHLNEFAAFLLINDRQNTPDSLKEGMVKQNSILLSILTSLPLKSTKRKCDELVDASDKLAVMLSGSTRIAIVNHLLSCVDYGLLNDHIVSKETQLSLISQNNKTIGSLLNLPIDTSTFFQSAADGETNEPDAKKQKGRNSVPVICTKPRDLSTLN